MNQERRRKQNTSHFACEQFRKKIVNWDLRTLNIRNQWHAVSCGLQRQKLKKEKNGIIPCPKEDFSLVLRGRSKIYSSEYDVMLEIHVEHIRTTRVRPWRRQARLATRSGAQITNARRAAVTTERGQTAGQRPAQDTVGSLEASQVAAHRFQQLECSRRWRGGGKRSSQRPSPRGAGGCTECYQEEPNKVDSFRF